MNRNDEKSYGRDERMTKLGAFLRDRRERKGLSVRVVARRANVSHSTLSRTERGQQLPISLEQLLGYAHALEMSTDDIALLLDLAGYQVDANFTVPAGSDLWQDYDFLSSLLEDAKRASDSGDYEKSRLYLTKIVLALRGNASEPFAELAARANVQLSKTLNLQDEPGKALRAAHEAQKIARSTDNLALDIEATHTLGVVLHKLKLEENALACYAWVQDRMADHQYPKVRRILLDRDIATALINLREFDNANLLITAGVKLFERENNVSGVVNFMELYGRGLSSAFRIPDAESEIKSLWASIQSLPVTPLERIRVLVILFKVHALKGEIEESLAYRQEIVEAVERYKLFAELHCLSSIAREVMIYRGDARWLKMLPNAE